MVVDVLVDDLVPGSLKGLVYVSIKTNPKKINFFFCRTVFSWYYGCGDNIQIQLLIP
jgi:hypothetical protein